MALRKKRPFAVRWIAAVLVVFAGVLIAALRMAQDSRRAAPAESGGSPVAPGASPGLKEHVSSVSRATGRGLAGPTQGTELIALLREKYGSKIHSPYIQVKMLEQLIKLYREKSKDTWQAEILEVLRVAFPDRYAELAANLQHWLDYEKWMTDNRTRLTGLSAAEQRQAIWDERNALFGKEGASQIWASELKGQALSDALAAIDAQPNLKIPEKLAQYKASLEDLQQEHTEQFMEAHRQELMNRFLDLDSVQNQLSSLDAQARTQSLREIRQGMGLNPEALARWDVLDHERDARWEDGAKYMQERALLEKYSGPDREQKFQSLREKYFSTEAEIIGQEEASGFFRFTRPRKWGRN